MSRRSFRLNRSEEIHEPIINLTALIDVVFVILIIFILVAPILELDNVELAEAGQSQESPAIETSPIAVYVKQDNTIWFNQQRVHPAELTTRLIEARAQYPKARLQLFHDKLALFGTYQQIKNAAEAAGFEDMDVILKPS